MRVCMLWIGLIVMLGATPRPDKASPSSLEENDREPVRKTDGASSTRDSASEQSEEINESLSNSEKFAAETSNQLKRLAERVKETLQAQHEILSGLIEAKASPANEA